MYGALRRATERLIVTSRLPAATVRWRRGRVLVLAFHNVVPDNQGPRGDGSLHLPWRRFLALLDRIERRATVISLVDAAAGRTNATRPNVVLTFDDAYRGAVRLGLPELARRGLPATLCVAPGLVGRMSLWWDDAAEAGLMDAAARGRVLREAAGADQPARRLLGLAGDTGLPEDWGVARMDELAVAARLPGIHFAAHSWSHRNLTALCGEALVREMVEPLAWLQAHFAAVAIPWVAYPYGLTSAPVLRAAAEAGYQGGLLVEGGWWPARAGGRFDASRFNVPSGLSDDGLSLRLAGILT